MIKKEPVMDILTNHGILLERAEEIANTLRLACHKQYGDEWIDKGNAPWKLTNIDGLIEVLKQIDQNNL